MRKSVNGKFIRSHNVWTPENWEDGYFDNKGRFRVYRPDYPNAYNEGYALRYHIVWWLHYGTPHPKGTEIHHIDLSKSNDNIENLALLSNSAHQRLHKANDVEIVCEGCGKVFFEHAWRVKQRGRRFCSSECYNSKKRSDLHRKAISDGLKRSYASGSR